MSDNMAYTVVTAHIRLVSLMYLELKFFFSWGFIQVDLAGREGFHGFSLPLLGAPGLDF